MLAQKGTNVRIGKASDVNRIYVKQSSIHAGQRPLFHDAGKPELLLQRDLADIASHCISAFASLTNER
jgi:hypothetical protein